MEDRGLAAVVVPRSAAGAMAERQKELNNRSIPKIPPNIQKLSDETKVYIFNVGPWKHVQFAGSMGRCTIQPCPEGQKYSEPLEIDGIVTELYPDTEKSMKIGVQEDGWDVAQSILGIGPGLAPNNSLKRYGVDVCRQWPPTEAEIKTAWNNLKSGELEGLIREANAAAATGPKAMEETINERHFQAARLLKKGVADCPWLVRSIATAERTECKFCGEPMKKNIPRCPNCKEIVDQALYDKLKGSQK